jgi:carbamoyl-phosphate synthase large subunit
MCSSHACPARAAEVARLREKRACGPCYKRIDTCAAEFASPHAYMYSTYEGVFAPPPANPPTDRKKIVILGGGPNRIGQGIEFDYCCCHAAYALREAGYETIMVNCNPETVSTDYDTSDRLYFEPLTAEDVLEILREQKQRHAERLHRAVRRPDAAQAPARWKPPASRSSAPPRRHRPCRRPRPLPALLHKLGLRSPKTASPQFRREAKPWPSESASRWCAPVLCAGRPRDGDRVRPDASLERYMLDRAAVWAGHQERFLRRPINILLDRYLNDAIEVDVDCLSDGQTFMSPASWSTSRKPASIRATRPAPCRRYTLSPAIVAELKRQTVPWPAR